MNQRLSRRTMITGATATAAALALPTGVLAAARLGVGSGGLGLTMDDIEAVYGPGQPGQSFMVYTDPTYGVDLHFGQENGIVDYAWLALGDEQTWTGTLLEDAWQLVVSLLPSDAQLHETYAMPETPGSIGGTEMARLTSAWLSSALSGRASILASVTSYPIDGEQVAMRGWIMVEQR